MENFKIENDDFKGKFGFLCVLYTDYSILFEIYSIFEKPLNFKPRLIYLYLSMKSAVEFDQIRTTVAHFEWNL